MSNLRTPRLLAAAALAAVAGACTGDSPTNPAERAPDARSFASAHFSGEAGVFLCKITFMSFDLADGLDEEGNPAPYVPGDDATLNVPFDFEITGGTTSQVTLPAQNWSALDAADCSLIYEGDATGGLTIVETSPESVMNSVFLARGFPDGAYNGGFFEIDWDGSTRTITLDPIPAGESWIVVKNTVTDTPPDGGQGCTPGYWRQEQHFGNWTVYSPGNDFDTAFGLADGTYDGTLLDAVWARGGGAHALARHAVAALLNAANPDVEYDLTVAAIQILVQNAFATGEFESAKNILAGYNEQGCDLGRAELEDAGTTEPTRGRSGR